MSGGPFAACSRPFWDGYPWLSAYLTRGVDNFCGEVLTSIFDDATKCVLDRRVVAFHKVPVHELDRE